jgi:hypothetical protein
MNEITFYITAPVQQLRYSYLLALVCLWLYPCIHAMPAAEACTQLGWARCGGVLQCKGMLHWVGHAGLCCWCH